MIIKDYKLKEKITIDSLIRDGFNYSVDCQYLSKVLTLKGSIVLWIKVYLKDFSLIIDVLDDDFGQYYTPFYDYKTNGDKVFKYLEEVVKRYNYEMDNMKSFEEVV